MTFLINPTPSKLGRERLPALVNLEAIKQELIRVEAKVLILDKITALFKSSGIDAEVAISIISQLKEMSRELNITIVALAHTPKMFAGTALGLDHVGGCKHLVNFADGVFFIAKSIQGNNIRYLKHVKGRNSEVSDKLYALEIVDSENQVILKYNGIDNEKVHLFENNSNMPDMRIQETKRLRE